jgi:hypothetical protein
VITTPISMSHKAILILRDTYPFQISDQCGISTSDLDLHVWKPPLVGNLRDKDSRDKDSSVINLRPREQR